MKFKASLTLASILVMAMIFCAVKFYGRVPAYSSGQVMLTLNPTSSSTPKGQSLTINVTVLDVTDLAAWQLLIRFNPLIVNCIAVTIPTDNMFDGDYTLLPPEINNTEGHVKSFCYFNQPYGLSGSGNICQISFQCLTPGITALQIVRLDCGLCATYLQHEDYTLIPFTEVDGMVEVTDQGFQANWFNMQSQPILVYSNSTITGFNVNETWKQMSFSATGTAGTNGSTTVVVPKTIINGTKMMVRVDGKPVIYTLSENTTHNFMQYSYSHSTRQINVLVTLLADLNGDRKIRVDDVLYEAQHFGTNAGEPGWDPQCDVTGDGKVRVDDVLFVAKEFGKTWRP
jgi:hypothetical protein